MVHSSTLHLLYLYYSTINICTISGTSGTTNTIDRSSNSHFLVNIYYTFIKNVPTLLASHDSSPICWRTVGTVPNVAYVRDSSMIAEKAESYRAAQGASETEEPCIIHVPGTVVPVAVFGVAAE